MINFIQRNSYIILLLIVVALSGYLRFQGLKDQGLLFYDEGAMIYRANNLRTALISSQPVKIFEQAYVDSKILWLVMIALVQFLFKNLTYAVNYLSLLFGVLSVTLAYLLSERIFQSKKTALLSAFLLSISAFHIYYSRLALPEASSAFMFTLSLYLYHKGLKSGLKYIMSAGIIFFAAFLMNRFRVGLLPLFFLLWETYNIISLQPWKTCAKRYTAFLLSVVSSFICFEILLFVPSSSGLHVPSLTSLLFKSASHHSAVFNAASFLIYPYYIYKFDGIFILLLFTLSPFFIRFKSTGFLFIIFIFIQMIFSSIVDESAPRAISVILPLLSIVCSVTLIEIHKLLSHYLNKKILTVIFAVAVIGSSLSLYLKVIHYHSDVLNAAKYLNQHFPKANILSTNGLIMSNYLQGRRIRMLINAGRPMLEKEHKNGFDLLITESHKFVTNNAKKAWITTALSPVMTDIEKKCIPIKTFNHFSDDLLNTFFLEHAFLKIKQPKESINDIKDTGGKIKIYNLGACLSRLSD